MITSERLTEWKRIENLVTPGPWINDEINPIHIINWRNKREAVAEVIGNEAGTCADKAFIAESRTAMPALIAEVESLQKDIKRLRDFVEQVASGMYRMTDMEGAQSDAQVLLIELKEDANE